MSLYQRLEANVTGRVQGVGYRYFARRCAERLDLNGWVRNERDRSVTVVAEGPSDVLDQFVALLEEGPPGSRVDKVSDMRQEGRGGFTSFDVRF